MQRRYLQSSYADKIAECNENLIINFRNNVRRVKKIRCLGGLPKQPLARGYPGHCLVRLSA
jgi:hypothetical protein